MNGSSFASCQYKGVQQSFKSSLVVLGRAFLSNRTYQFMVQLRHKRNPSRQGTGFLLVRVEETFSPLIVISSPTSTLLIPNSEYQLINPTTQLSLVARCEEKCSSTEKPNITWNIHQGKKNLTQWTLFNRTNLQYFFGQFSTFFLFVFTSSIQD